MAQDGKEHITLKYCQRDSDVYISPIIFEKTLSILYTGIYVDAAYATPKRPRAVMFMDEEETKIWAVVPSTGEEYELRFGTAITAHVLSDKDLSTFAKFDKHLMSVLLQSLQEAQQGYSLSYRFQHRGGALLASIRFRRAYRELITRARALDSQYDYIYQNVATIIGQYYSSRKGPSTVTVMDLCIHDLITENLSHDPFFTAFKSLTLEDTNIPARIGRLIKKRERFNRVFRILCEGASVEVGVTEQPLLIQRAETSSPASSRSDSSQATRSTAASVAARDFWSVLEPGYIASRKAAVKGVNGAETNGRNQDSRNLDLYDLQQELGGRNEVPDKTTETTERAATMVIKDLCVSYSPVGKALRLDARPPNIKIHTSSGPRKIWTTQDFLESPIYESKTSQTIQSTQGYRSQASTRGKIPSVKGESPGECGLLDITRPDATPTVMSSRRPLVVNGSNSSFRYSSGSRLALIQRKISRSRQRRSTTNPLADQTSDQSKSLPRAMLGSNSPICHQEASQQPQNSVTEAAGHSLDHDIINRIRETVVTRPPKHLSQTIELPRFRSKHVRTNLVSPEPGPTKPHQQQTPALAAQQAVMTQGNGRVPYLRPPPGFDYPQPPVLVVAPPSRSSRLTQYSRTDAKKPTPVPAGTWGAVQLNPDPLSNPYEDECDITEGFYHDLPMVYPQQGSAHFLPPDWTIDIQAILNSCSICTNGRDGNSCFCPVDD